MTDMSYTKSFPASLSCKPAFNDAGDGHETPRGNPPPYSMRFTWEERARLKEEAGNKSWAALIRERVFGKHVSKRRKTRHTSADLQAIARLSAMLGKTRIPNNLNQLSKAANTGCLVMDDDTKRQLSEACAHVTDMRQLLIAALGVKDSQNRHDS